MMIELNDDEARLLDAVVLEKAQEHCKCQSKHTIDRFNPQPV